MTKWLLVFASFAAINILQAQSTKLSFTLADHKSKLAISGAHVFVDNSSIGTISNQEGLTSLTLSPGESQALIVSHISYETIFIPFESYRNINPGDTILLQSNEVVIDDINIVADRGRSWKRNFRKFERAFLGEGKPASKCRILNPEVLRFEMKDKALHTTAIDLIEIENDHLAYQISFLLKESIIEEDGTSRYQGYAKYENIREKRDRRVEKLRERYYTNSLQHFLLSLIHSPDEKSLKDNGYRISIEKYLGGRFRNVVIPSPKDLITIDSLTGNFHLKFSDFLTVKHLKIKSKATSRQTVAISGAEQQKFGTDRSQDMTANCQPVISRLFKVEKQIIFNKQGIILNKKAYREYGYWADQRIATSLPFDYKADIPMVALRKVPASVDTLQVFLDFIGNEKEKQKAAYEFINEHWTDAFIAPLLDIIRMSGIGWHANSAQALLRTHVPQMKAEFYEGLQYLWAEPKSYGDYYHNFKAQLYKSIDPAFYRYFHERSEQSKIRLDEVLWGGVRQDGIPPLRNPKMIQANKASYLNKSDQVFGLLINGKAFAYPQRILAWHEFFTDEIEGVQLAGVYCTLCGSVVIYNATKDGVFYELGTSGFLYRSNKLMYDKSTQSLWSMLLGKPVIGPLAEQNLELSVIPVETTNWASWLERYPNSLVLSLDTGYERDYGAGVAYKEYYANDRLMFPVPLSDKRLKNKERVFIPRIEGYELDPLGITVEFLSKNQLYTDQVNGNKVLFLTDDGNASRAYLINGYGFKSFKNGVLIDDSGSKWEVFDDRIRMDNVELVRIPAHEVFWFAWFNNFPHTRLIK